MLGVVLSDVQQDESPGSLADCHDANQRLGHGHRGDAEQKNGRVRPGDLERTRPYKRSV